MIFAIVDGVASVSVCFCPTGLRVVLRVLAIGFVGRKEFPGSRRYLEEMVEEDVKKRSSLSRRTAIAIPGQILSSTVVCNLMPQVFFLC